MQSEVVSRKLLSVCIFCSILLLAVFSYIYSTHDSVLYICNEKDTLDMYQRVKGKDIIVKPQNIKNILSCLGRGMPFYDRTIERLEGSISYAMQKELYARYTVVEKKSSSLLDKGYSCISGKKQYLIIQKNIELTTLIRSIDSCKADTIIINAKYKNNKIIEALQSHKYNIDFIDNGSYRKIIL